MTGPVRLKEEVRLEALSFVPQPMVSWLSPRQLGRSAAEVVISGLFGKFSDKRELQTWKQEPFDHRAEELWVDFASDTGDGFHPTSTVAWSLSRERLTVGETELPRADVLVLGGDQVYPSAGRRAYEDRFIGPYSGALPVVEPEESAPWLYALPGNHDWYDGLTSFLRVFCQERWIGGWRTGQQRSYFALRLPEPWWLWAVDIQFDTDVDELQLDYFRAAADEMGDGNRLLLLTAKPSWLSSEYRPESYRNLAYIERKLVPQGVTVAATLTGDVHHYNRYVLEGDAPPSVPRQRITAGGAGAYTSPTHTLPPDLPLPREPWGRAQEGQPDCYVRRAEYPQAPVSKGLANGVVLATLRTRPFAALLGGLYALLAAAMLAAIGGGAHEHSWTELPGEAIGGASVVLALLVVAALSGYADFRHPLAKLAVGVAHAAPHVAFALTALWAVSRIVTGDTAVWFAAIPGAALTGAVAGSLVFGLYLLLVHRTRGARAPSHTNEAFAGQGLTSHKCFLRLHVKRNGPVTVHAVGIDEACEDWTVVDEGGRTRIVPAACREPGARPIEPAFELP
ncbi:MAG: hypothetical protein ACRDPC_16255 [Solirubrobacteraceae bacterium]